MGENKGRGVLGWTLGRSPLDWMGAYIALVSYYVIFWRTVTVGEYAFMSKGQQSAPGEESRISGGQPAAQSNVHGGYGQIPAKLGDAIP